MRKTVLSENSNSTALISALKPGNYFGATVEAETRKTLDAKPVEDNFSEDSSEAMPIVSSKFQRSAIPC